MRKNGAAVALGRKGGLKGGLARATRLTPAQRSASASASAAVRVRWAKAGKIAVSNTPAETVSTASTADTSDRALAALLERLRTTTDLAEIRQLSDKIERVVFHKQFENA
jgi:hypothetical protein